MVLSKIVYRKYCIKQDRVVQSNPLKSFVTRKYVLTFYNYCFEKYVSQIIIVLKETLKNSKLNLTENGNNMLLNALYFILATVLKQ